ncbi:MAG: endospore germination permease [Bacilli bacterium]|jgi:spore germination protein
MANRITNRQMFFIIILILTTYSTIDLPKIVAQTSGRTSWIPIIVMALIFGISAIIITKLNNMHMGQVFFDYSKGIVGKLFTYIIASYYVLYFFIIGIHLKMKLVGALSANFLPKTPQFVFLLFAIALFGYVSYKGVTNVARLVEIYGFLFLITTVGICIFILMEGTKYNVLPFFSMSEIKQITYTMKDLIIPYGGTEVLLVVPFTIQNKKAPKVAFFTLLFIGLLYVLIVESTISVLGINNTMVLNDSFIEAIKITTMPIIERLDIFYLTFGLSNLFCGMIIVFTTIVELISKILPKVKRHIIVIALSLLFFSVSLLALKMINIEEMFKTISVYLALLSSFVIPITLFVIAKSKKKRRYNEES